MKSEAKKDKRLIGVLIAVAATVAIAIIAFMTIGGESEPYELDMLAGEPLAAATARAAIAQSAADGKGEWHGMDCVTLAGAVKAFDDKSKWFSNCPSTLYGSIPDTDSEKVIKLSDGNYCATITFDNDMDYITSYDFSEGRCGDSRISLVSSESATEME